MSDSNPYRLPDDVVPSHYDLRLEPDLVAASFDGTCTITANVVRRVDRIVVNAAELTIHDAEVRQEDRHLPVTVELDAEHERATFRLDAELEPGPCTIHTRFTGELNDKLRGFYRSTFTDDDGAEQVIATTQFESTNARRAFPCWDEPARKAVFDITLVVPGDLTAVSCTSEIPSEPAGADRRVVRFAPTPIMSTYLLAFVVGDLEVTEPVDVDGVPLRVVHPPGKGHLTDFALEAGAFSLRWFTDYFAIAYPGDKLDLVAIPDFAFGAMENLGCVTFREVLLLVDPTEATQPELQNVTDVIAHEIAHMWFGDLVTMKWWNGIWLKEAFATFMEMLLTDAFRPDWERWVTFGLSRTAALDVDALAATRPIEYPVVSPDDAEGMYDLLTYEKGAGVVRMLEQYLGADAFREGIRHYLERHAFGSTETTDLWDALEETTEEPTRRIMDSWIFQGGHPVVTVDHLGPSRVRLTQRRFSYRPTDPAEWSVPVVLALGRDGRRDEHRLLLDQPSIEVDLPGDPPDWLLANSAGNGFFRVGYDQSTQDALLGALDQLSAVERYGVVDDGWAMVIAGESSAVDFLRLADRFAAEDDLSVWQRIIAALGAIDHIVDPAVTPHLAAKVGELVAGIDGRLGPAPRADDTDRIHQLRGAILQARGVLGRDEAARSRAREMVSDGAPHPSLEAAAVAVVADNGDRGDYATYLDRLEHAASPQEERRYLFALASFPGLDEFTTTLEMAVDGRVRTQDAPYLLGRALGHREHGPVAWAFIRDRWAQLGEQFPSNSIPRMLEGIRSLSQPEVADDVRSFLADHPVPQGAKTVEQHLERLSINVELRAREAPRLAAALS